MNLDLAPVVFELTGKQYLGPDTWNVISEKKRSRLGPVGTARWRVVSTCRHCAMGQTYHIPAPKRSGDVDCTPKLATEDKLQKNLACKTVFTVS